MERAFETSVDHGRRQLWITITVASITAPVLGYFMAGFTVAAWLLGIAALAGFLAIAIYGLRSFWWIQRVVINDETITVHKGKKIFEEKWDDIREMEFQHLNNTPWMFIRNKPEAGDKSMMFCIENMDESTIAELSQTVSEMIPRRTIISEEWIIANRIPVTTSKKRK